MRLMKSNSEMIYSLGLPDVTSSVVARLLCLHVLMHINGGADTMGNSTGPDRVVRVPDEQRLYETLMDGYEKSVRPVYNSSAVLTIRFGLHLNQIVGLDERHQVLTTNVFIDQEWRDENFEWDPELYNNIKSIRIPAKNVWLPDTFIYNNADGGSTGFMQGTYVLVNHNATVLWPVPVKLKSSCKVDITYFPFDDQTCILRFGSWIYSGLWMDYVTMHDDRQIDLSSYVNNSEWDLLSVVMKKNIRTHSCCPDPHPDLTYMLHMRRKTFYYIFNIIVPCIMLSILTLLTFWLPPTSGEKITLGLSVFLAFSMFMLLIAEEVPATSEAVPLIGIYLCVVMTLTSLSVIMAVMVINLYNRGTQTRRAPYWVRVLFLQWISFPLRMKHDLARVVETISLENEAEGTDGNIQDKRRRSLKKSRESTLNSIQEYRRSTIRRRHSEMETSPVTVPIEPQEPQPTTLQLPEPETQNEPEPEVIWVRRDDVHPTDSTPKSMQFEMGELGHDRGTPKDLFVTNSKQDNGHSSHTNRRKDRLRNNNRSPHDFESDQQQGVPLPVGNNRNTSIHEDHRKALYYRKLIVAEWQRVAAVVDRILFWLYFIGTMVAYLVILIVIPRQIYAEWDAQVVHMPQTKSESRYMM